MGGGVLLHNTWKSWVFFLAAMEAGVMGGGDTGKVTITGTVEALYKHPVLQRLGLKQASTVEW